jgi:hypothetical protein
MDLLHKLSSLDWSSGWIILLDFLEITNDDSYSFERSMSSILSGLEGKVISLSL